MNEQATMMIQQQQQPLMSMNQINHRHQPPQMVQMNHTYGIWPIQQQQQQQFRNPNSGFNKSLGPRSNWKGKKVNSKPNDKRRMDQSQNQKKPLIRGVDVINGIGNSNFKSFNNNNNNNPWRFFPKRKFDKNNITNNNIPTNYSRSAPFAPRNTTSFIIRSKKSGGIAPLVSPCPVTPTILTTPILSPSRELLVDTAKEEWGVDGYGSMKGLIRLREMDDDVEDEDEGGSSGSDLEEHVEVERRLDHDLSRFEMIYNPNGANVNNGLENRVDDQDGHIARLEGANLDLKERLFFVERELGDLRRRMVCLEGMGNGSGNESEGRVEEEECEDGLDVGDENNVNDYDNNTIGVESKEESNENSNDSTYANNVDADNVNENHCVDPKVEIKDNCVLVKDYMDLAKDGAN